MILFYSGDRAGRRELTELMLALRMSFMFSYHDQHQNRDRKRFALVLKNKKRIAQKQEKL